MTQYLLDANVFIQAKRFNYPFDVFPGFWDWLEREMGTGVLKSIMPIYDELSVGSDELVEWSQQRKEAGCFLPIDDINTQKKFSDIAAWAVDPLQQFKPPAYEEFLRVGDSWLIAKALSTNSIIVTHEKYDPNCKRKILIPNVCNAFDIKYINIIELIRRTGVRFRI